MFDGVNRSKLKYWKGTPKTRWCRDCSRDYGTAYFPNHKCKAKIPRCPMCGCMRLNEAH